MAHAASRSRSPPAVRITVISGKGAGTSKVVTLPESSRSIVEASMRSARGGGGGGSGGTSQSTGAMPAPTQPIPQEEVEQRQTAGDVVRQAREISKSTGISELA